ncbi:sigma-70 family RNA polymerase sigma factor [Paenibacillus sp. LHD-117]|uniref:RNA polymerase sigma factor n=1 Tax=Paenibacillus sp. LHD-117 TaxID=3071412 RepID=UPI0027E06CE8|nr:sigma-70 family RNA polymerase sigma factor [Paenibacillus sp. LHD-117]MDQ6420167.1 sigma-70 family RNA polymerase sigma factor [Paenibacillus sp. LHD-117]
MRELINCFAVSKNNFKEAQGFAVRQTSIHAGREESDIHDETWIIAVRDGGPEQYRPFVQAYGSYIYKTVYAVLQSPHDAEDVTQEVLLQIYRSLPNYRMDGLKTWITRIAVNRAIDYKRSKARRPEQLFDQAEVIEQGATTSERARGMLDASPSSAAEEIAMTQERLRFIHERVSGMPDNYREVVEAFYIEEKSYEQIAAETGLERKSVESRLYRARSWMKRHWRKEDFE